MSTDSAKPEHDSANDERTEIARDIDDGKAEAIASVFEREFHMTGVQAYLEYYQL